MYSCSVVGYVPQDSGLVLCVDCTPKNKRGEYTSVFADSEWDYRPACDKCGRTLDVRLTQYGQATES